MNIILNKIKGSFFIIYHNNFLILLISILLPERIGVKFIFLFIVFTLIPIERKNQKRLSLNNETKFILGILIFIFLYSTLSLLWSSEFLLGIKDLEKITSFILFPILFLFNRNKIRVNYRCAFKIFLISINILLLLCFAIAFYHSLINVGFQKWPFKYYNFTYWVDFHPGYLSLLLLLALVIIKYGLINMRVGNNDHIFYLTSFIFLSFSLFFIGSKFAIITYFLNTFLFFCIYFKRQRNIVVSIFVILFLLIISSLVSMNTKNRIYDIYNSFELRKEINQASINLISKRPIIGYGFGSVNNELLSEYEKLNIEPAYNDKLNAHNQFLQTFLSTGVIGFVALISIFYFLLRMPLNRQFNTLLMLQFFIFFLTESALERQRGIVPFMIFILLLIMLQSNKLDSYYFENKNLN